MRDLMLESVAQTGRRFRSCDHVQAAGEKAIMSKLRIKSFIVAVVLLWAQWPSFGQESPAVKVTPWIIGEGRVQTQPSWVGPSDSLPERLSLTLILEGPSIAGATQWHGVHIDEA